MKNTLLILASALFVSHLALANSPSNVVLSPPVLAAFAKCNFVNQNENAFRNKLGADIVIWGDFLKMEGNSRPQRMMGMVTLNNSLAHTGIWITSTSQDRNQYKATLHSTEAGQMIVTMNLKEKKGEFEYQQSASEHRRPSKLVCESVLE